MAQAHICDRCGAPITAPYAPARAELSVSSVLGPLRVVVELCMDCHSAYRVIEMLLENPQRVQALRNLELLSDAERKAASKTSAATLNGLSWHGIPHGYEDPKNRRILPDRDPDVADPRLMGGTS